MKKQAKTKFFFSFHEGQALKGRRRGMGLPMALLIILIGAALMTFAFDAAARFRYMSFQQERMYLDHTLVTGYIEEAKGRISKYNSEKKKALRNDFDLEHNKITRPEDMVIVEIPAISGVLSHYNLSLDIPIPERQQALTLRVYNASYQAEQVADGLAPVTLARIPSPIPLVARILEGQPGLNGDDSQQQTPDTYKPGGGGPRTDIMSEQLGSYLIRAELFNIVKGQRVRTRLLEEAFVQIASGDRD